MSTGITVLGTMTEASLDDLAVAQEDLARAKCNIQAAKRQLDQAENHLRLCEANQPRIDELNVEIGQSRNEMDQADERFDAIVGRERGSRVRRRADKAIRCRQSYEGLVAEREQLQQDLASAETEYLAAVDALDRAESSVARLNIVCQLIQARNENSLAAALPVAG